MTKATLLVCAGLLLCAIPAAAVVPCNLYVRSSDGNDGDNGSTWALAKATLAGAVTAWTSGDVICVEDNHAESSATGQVYSATGDGPTDWVKIYSVSDADDSYSIGSAAQVEVTGASPDLTFTGYFASYGIYYKSGDNINVGGGSGIFYAVDNYFELTSGNATFIYAGAAGRGTTIINSTIDLGAAASGGFIQGGSVAVAFFEDLTIVGTATAGGVFRTNTSSSTTLVFNGGDWSGVDLATNGAPIFDLSPGLSTYILLNSVLLPSSYTLTDDGLYSLGDKLLLTGTDTAAGKIYNQFVEDRHGTISVDHTTYYDTAPVFLSGSWSSIKFVPGSYLTPALELCSWPIATTFSTTGSKTLTFEGVENYTTPLTTEQVFLRLYYLGTSSSTKVTQLRTKEVGSTTSLSTGAGLGAWTGEPAGSRSIKLEETFTINQVGPYRAVLCVAVPFESGKAVYFAPVPDVS